MSHDENWHFETLTVHAGVEPDPATGAVMTPIYQTSTYAQTGINEHKGYDYSRTANPTRTALQNSVAALERAKHALAYSSGLAAIDNILRQIRPGEHVISGNDVYGGTFRMFDKILSVYGLEFSYVNTTDTEAIKAAIQPNTKLIWLETPTNPYLRVTDIAAAADLAHEAGAWLGVDNTFASPALQNPLNLGADIVAHSTTKYIAGHSDVVGGVVAMNDDELFAKMKFNQNALGAVPGPMDCFLTLRGIKTLALRMATHSANAMKIAQFLADHPAVSEVHYPGLESHPQHEVAMRQMSAAGGMISFLVRNGVESAIRVAQKTRLFTLAESLGGVESLIEIPAAMTHASVAESTLAVEPGLIRISVGIEHVEDLMTDLGKALQNE
ncbi:MAG: cystathionine gamma-synthase [Ardenticatenales bacterium]|nr:cystathionine gamma-synthase [Ardenticatenales bacterium]